MRHPPDAKPGGKGACAPEDHGFLYQRNFQDPDGNVVEPFWMDPRTLAE